MPLLGHRLAFTQLLVAVGVNLLFVASTAGPAIGSRASIAIPNLSRALSHLTDLSPTTDFDSESLTATDDNANITSLFGMTWLVLSNETLKPMPLKSRIPVRENGTVDRTSASVGRWGVFMW